MTACCVKFVSVSPFFPSESETSSLGGSHPRPVLALQLRDELPLLFVGIQRVGEVCRDPLLLSLLVKPSRGDIT